MRLTFSVRRSSCSSIRSSFGDQVEADAFSVSDLRSIAVAPTPIRARSAEALMEGAECSGDLAARAAKAAAGEISPIDDVRASAWYRTHLTEVFVRRLIEDVCHG